VEIGSLKRKRVKASKKHSASSKQWLERHLNDPYVAAAQQAGYRARSAFKLLQLDEKFHFLHKISRVVDLGSAPGSWSQIAKEKCAFVVALDLLPMEDIEGVTFVQMDFTSDEAPEKLKDILAGKADVVLSDMAPNTTGHSNTDHLRIVAITELAAQFAVEVLREGGTFVCKFFQGGAEKSMLDFLKRNFKTVKHAKPKASRSESAESYIVAMGFRRMWNVKCGIKPLLAILLFCCAFIMTSTALAQSRMMLIRDQEIENYLKTLSYPIFRAANLEPNNINIFIIQDRNPNAFVAEGMNQFFNTGLLQLTETPEQLAGVIAHETGHISGGHLIRGKEEMNNAYKKNIIGTILATAVGVASGNPGLAAGGALLSGHVAERSFLKFNRVQEASADLAAAKYLEAAGISQRGLSEFFQKLKGQEFLPEERQMEYVRTHPLNMDRIDAIDNYLSLSKTKDNKMSEEIYTMHERMRAKLLGYLQPQAALLRYGEKDDRISARYARTFALYRTGKTEQALKSIESLIKDEPANPYFYELKAQIKFESGRIEEAIASYQKLNELYPNSALFKQAYAKALIENKNKDKELKRLERAEKLLLEANALEPDSPWTWRLLATSWGRQAGFAKTEKQHTLLKALATYALAEEALALGNEKNAARLAERAMKDLDKGSAYWLRAQDISLISVESEK